MASAAMGVKALIFIGFVIAAHSLTLDQETTGDIKAAALSTQTGGEVAFVVGLHSRGTRRAELLHFKGPDDHSVSLFYNRKSHKVSLETLYEGHLKSVSWGLGSDTKGTLTLVVSSNRVKLHIGCRPLHYHALSGRYDLLTLLTNKDLRFYHEEHAPVQIYGNERAALDSLGCEIREDNKATLVSVDDMVEVKHIDVRPKEEEEMQGDDYRTNLIDSNGILPTQRPRGDIPSTDIDCDEKVFRQLEILSQTVEKLRREITDQKGTIDSLNRQLKECCHRVPLPDVERCTESSCYRGH